jgi:excisionase family DNA binding protein
MEQGTNLERDLAPEVPGRSVPASIAQTTLRGSSSEPPPLSSERRRGTRKPRRAVAPPTNRMAKLRAPIQLSCDSRGQTSVEANPDSESLASLVRRRRTAWTAEELAEVLSLSRKHIYKMAKKGRMPSLRIGGAIRFDPHATAAWLESKAIQ